MTRVLVCGSRVIDDDKLVFKILDIAECDITELVSGGAIGVDKSAEKWANARGIKVTQFIPDWEKEPRKAGIIRNREMVKYAEAVIAIWNGTSRGTESTIKFARKHKKPLKVWHV
jgi:YspA, cpYpsA-related SLOG family